MPLRLKAFNEPPLSLNEFARLDYISRATNWRVASSREFFPARTGRALQRQLSRMILVHETYSRTKTWPKLLRRLTNPPIFLIRGPLRLP